MPSTSTSMSAQRCFTAWKLPIGRSNCTRSLAYSTDSSSSVLRRARAARPRTRSRHGRRTLAPRRVRRARSASLEPGRIEPADLAGEVHGRLARGRPRAEVDRDETRRRARTTATSADGRVRDDLAPAGRGDAGDHLTASAAVRPRRAAQRVERRRWSGRSAPARRGRRPPRQHGHLDPAEADAAVGLGHRDGRPALVDHRLPQLRVERGTAVDRRRAPASVRIDRRAASCAASRSACWSSVSSKSIELRSRSEH